MTHSVSEATDTKVFYFEGDTYRSSAVTPVG